MSAQHSRPLWIGILACIASPVLLLGIPSYFSADRVMIPPELVAMVALAGALFATLFVALPYVLWLRRKQKLSALRIYLAGAVAGAVVLGAFNFHMSYFPQIEDQGFALSSALRSAIRTAIPGAIVGLLSAAALCLGAGIPFRAAGARSIRRS